MDIILGIIWEWLYLFKLILDHVLEYDKIR